MEKTEKRRSQALECIAKLKDGKYIILYLASGGKELKISVGIQTTSKYFEDGQFKSGYGKNYKEMNSWLQGQRNRINLLIREAYEKKVNAVEYIKNVISKEKVANNEAIIKGNQSICEAYKIYIDNKYERNMNAISERSFDRYVNEHKRLQDFDSKTTLSQVNMKWINQFVVWLATKKTINIHVIDNKSEREFEQTKTISMGNTTIKRFLDDLITFFKAIKEAVDIEYPQHFMADLKKLRESLTTNTDDPRNIVAMSQEELNAFREHKKNLKFKWQIDTFNAYLAATLCGLRHSDLILLSTSYINNDNEIVMNLQKTTIWVNIPVRTELMDILNYYNGSLVGKLPTIQRLNINLRKILKTIPIFQRDDKEYEFILNKKRVLDVKRWERFTFHTSRKNFITLSIRNRATYDMIKDMTGIQDFRTLNHYMQYKNSSNNNRQILTF